jgi:hypothetical protein
VQTGDLDHEKPLGLRRHLCRLETLQILTPGLRDSALHLLCPNGVGRKKLDFILFYFTLIDYYSLPSNVAI